MAGVILTTPINKEYNAIKKYTIEIIGILFSLVSYSPVPSSHAHPPPPVTHAHCVLEFE